MSKEIIGPKKSSTIAAKAAYQLLLNAGYRPRLVDPEKPLRSDAWDAVIIDKNVMHSASGKSIQMIDASGQNRPPIDLKIKGMMSENSITFFQKHAHVPLKPAP